MESCAHSRFTKQQHNNMFMKITCLIAHRVQTNTYSSTSLKNICENVHNINGKCVSMDWDLLKKERKPAFHLMIQRWMCKPSFF